MDKKQKLQALSSIREANEKLNKAINQTAAFLLKHKAIPPLRLQPIPIVFQPCQCEVEELEMAVAA